MRRITWLILCAILAAAAAGRYRAEAEVRAMRQEIRDLELKKGEEERQIQVLRAEIAYLERPDRLARIVAETELRPLSSAQLLTAEDFLAAFGSGSSSSGPTPIPPIDYASARHAMADPAGRSD
jgi:hypothetical protein